MAGGPIRDSNKTIHNGWLKGKKGRRRGWGKGGKRVVSGGNGGEREAKRESGRGRGSGRGKYGGQWVVQWVVAGESMAASGWYSGVVAGGMPMAPKGRATTLQQTHLPRDFSVSTPISPINSQFSPFFLQEHRTEYSRRHTTEMPIGNSAPN